MTIYSLGRELQLALILAENVSDIVKEERTEIEDYFLLMKSIHSVPESKIVCKIIDHLGVLREKMLLILVFY